MNDTMSINSWNLPDGVLLVNEDYKGNLHYYWFKKEFWKCLGKDSPLNRVQLGQIIYRHNLTQPT